MTASDTTGLRRKSAAALAVIPPVSSADFADPDWIAPFARAAERLGFESLVLPEHVVLAVDYTSTYPYSKSGRVPLPHDCVIPDPLDTLAYVAGVTTTLGLATGLLVLPLHSPLMLAKRAATIDRLSRGRLRLGVGLGWLREELEAGGVDFAGRGARADESIDAIRALWSADPHTGAHFEGRQFSFSGVQSFPRPTRAAGVPIEVGGTTPAAIRPRGAARRRMAVTRTQGRSSGGRAAPPRRGGGGGRARSRRHRRDPQRSDHGGLRRSRHPRARWRSGRVPGGGESRLRHAGRGARRAPSGGRARRSSPRRARVSPRAAVGRSPGRPAAPAL